MHRLRDPVRVRHLPADLRRRVAGREARRLAGPRVAVGVPAPRVGRHRGLRRPHGALRRRRRHALALGAGLERPGHPVQLHGPRLRERPRQHAAPLVRPGDPRVRPRDLQRRRLRPGRARADLRGEHLQGPLPRGLDAAGQGAAPPAAVLLRRLLDPGLPRPGAAAGLRPAQPPGPDHLPAQRHAPRHRDPGAHADPRRREEVGVGRGLGGHPEVLRVHLPHAAARGARGLVDRPAGQAAAAPPRDHLQDQRGVHGGAAHRVPGRRAARAPHVDHRRVPRARRPHGLPGDGGRLQGQRRRGPALAAAARQGAARLLGPLPGQVHQRHQRRHAPPVRPARQPGALGPDHVGDRRRLGHRPGASAGARAAGRRRRLPRGVPAR